MRKRGEMGEIDAVRRVANVASRDYIPRKNAHRLAIAEDAFLLAQERRIQAQSRRAPADPSKRKPLNIQLYVTRYRSALSTWNQIEALIGRLNQLFHLPQLVFQLVEAAECNRSVSHAQRCSFRADLDHDFEWLHMAVVPRLPQELPLLPVCGRCILISDRSQDEDIARGLAQLLGLAPDCSLKFSLEDIQWLRWQAFLLQGQAVPLPFTSVAVWVYPVVTPDDFHSQRSRAQIKQLLEQANLVWLQAGISFELAGCCPLHRCDISQEDWQQAITPAVEPLIALSEFATQALHLTFIRSLPVVWSCFAYPQQRLAMVGDGASSLSLAQALGQLLGLTQVDGTEQLMSLNAEGNRLSASEILRARQRCSQISGLTVDTAVEDVSVLARRAWLRPPLPQQTVLEFKLILLRGPETGCILSMSQAKTWLDEVAGVWQQAGIALQAHISEAEVNAAAVEAAYPNPGGEKKPSCAGLTRLAAYTAGCFNLFVLQRLPWLRKPEQSQAYLNWPGPRVLLLAYDFPAHGAVKQLALALAVACGVKPGEGACQRLLTRGSQGLCLDASDSQLLLQALAGPGYRPPAVISNVAVSWDEQLKLPLKLRRVVAGENACSMTLEELRSLICSEEMWSVAGIVPEIVEADEVEVEQQALQESYHYQWDSQSNNQTRRIPFNFALLRLPGQNVRAINIFVVGNMPGGQFSSFPLTRMLVADARCVVAGILSLLGIADKSSTTKQSWLPARTALSRMF